MIVQRKEIFLLLGTNLGDRVKNLRNCINYISKIGKLSKISAIYETAPWGKINQSDFLNQTIMIETSQNPEELLNLLKGIELKIGRKEGPRWEERIIDIDILFYSEETITSPLLTIPHPQLENRRFALVPLCEIAPDFIHPVLKKSILQLLNECQDPLKVEKYNNIEK